jgi:CheY-like chemotaxis protein
VRSSPTAPHAHGRVARDQQWVMQEAANGREALVRLQGVAPDVILLDLMTLSRNLQSFSAL